MLSLVDFLDLGRCHVLHAVRADLLRRLGRTAEAVTGYRVAAEAAGSEVAWARPERQRRETAPTTT
ncbi:hypothetical protein SRB17_56020 [Streptomyces sp. RB17]|uniref:hypothetical protein n=1 Tax=Streptomyces sp. RB17 TaxID=2585197 RepID=UPI00130A945D|nr:hypothetical protein [Streptomyces sp. RB17]